MSGSVLHLDVTAGGALRLIDMTGRVARVLHVGPGRQTVNLHGVRTGRYMLELTGGERTQRWPVFVGLK